MAPNKPTIDDAAPAAKARPVGILLALAGVLLLTPDTLLIRIGDMSGNQTVAWRGLLSSLVYFVIWLFTRRGGLVADFIKLGSVAGILVILSQAMNASLFALGVAIAPVSVVLFGVATVPIIAAILSWLIAGEGVSKSLWITTILVFFGITLAIFGGEGGGIVVDTNTIIGGLFGIGVGFSIALSLVLIRLHSDLPFVLAIAVGALLSGIYGYIMAAGDLTSGGDVIPIIITGIFILPVSFFMLSLASRYTLPANVSLILLLETVLGPIWVWWGVGEAPTTAMIIGGVIVVTTLARYLWLNLRREKPQG